MTSIWKGRRSRTLMVLASGLAVAVLVLVAVTALRSGSPAAQAAGTSEPTTTFDAGKAYPNVLPVYFVSGTPYEMGYQYGVQARDAIARNACYARLGSLYKYKTWADIVTALDALDARLPSQAPDVLETWRGMADGSGVSYDEIRLLNADPHFPGCSAISAWGSATKGGQVIAGANGDVTWLGYGFPTSGQTGCVIVAFPSNGNSFISSVPSTGLWTAERSMNSKGLVLMMSGAQAARPEDTAATGYPGLSGYVEATQRCDTAAQAKDAILGYKLSNPNNTNIVDTTGDAYEIESTSAVSAVRTSGDFGERDYLISTNHELCKDMQVTQPADLKAAGWTDTLTRYGTEEKLVKAGHGKLTAGSLMAILGSHDYWDGKKWHRDVLTEQPAIDPQTWWTPGMRSSSWNPCQREVFLPGSMTAYILTGNDDPLFSTMPNATGEFFKLVLGKTPAEVTDQAQADARKQIWCGAVALHRSSRPSAARLAELNQAKTAVVQGMNLQVQAGLVADPNQAALLLGQAMTCFCTAQCYAEQAQGIVSNSGTVPPAS